MSNKNITPEVVNTIENALEERKAPNDRRRETDVRSPFVDPQMDRRSGEDRRESSSAENE